MTPRLLLFDVDGTLVTARGAGRLALTRALEITYGTAGDAERYDFRGRTDRRIVWDVLRAAGVPEARIAERLAACFETYVVELTALIGDGHRVTVMPGVVDLVRALAARPDTLVGLLTGNIEAGARVKLAPTGLWPLFRVGAFGGEHVERRRLAPVARARAEALVGAPLPFARVTIIGDTPHDVDCARACGARAVAVATGFYAAEELAASAPDHLFQDFADTAHALAVLADGAP